MWFISLLSSKIWNKFGVYPLLKCISDDQWPLHGPKKWAEVNNNTITWSEKHGLKVPGTSILMRPSSPSLLWKEKSSWENVSQFIHHFPSSISIQNLGDSRWLFCLVLINLMNWLQNANLHSLSYTDTKNEDWPIKVSDKNRTVQIGLDHDEEILFQSSFITSQLTSE